MISAWKLTVIVFDAISDIPYREELSVDEQERYDDIMWEKAERFVAAHNFNADEVTKALSETVHGTDR